MTPFSLNEEPKVHGMQYFFRSPLFLLSAYGSNI